jgi:hypothetical protein
MPAHSSITVEDPLVSQRKSKILMSTWVGMLKQDM